MKLNVFYKFRTWKAFAVWHTNVREKKVKNARKSLEENLFFLNQVSHSQAHNRGPNWIVWIFYFFPFSFFFVIKSLRPALLNVREMCYRISDMSLCKIDKGRTYALGEFKETQYDQLTEVSKRLSEFRDLVKEIVCSACRTALFEAGFTPDNYFYESETTMDMIGGGVPQSASSQFMQSNPNIDIYGEAPDKMTYTEQANKRSHCQRLTWYACIFITNNLLYATMRPTFLQSPYF